MHPLKRMTTARVVVAMATAATVMTLSLLLGGQRGSAQTPRVAYPTLSPAPIPPIACNQVPLGPGMFDPATATQLGLVVTPPVTAPAASGDAAKQSVLAVYPNVTLGTPIAAHVVWAGPEPPMNADFWLVPIQPGSYGFEGHGGVVDPAGNPAKQAASYKVAFVDATTGAFALAVEGVASAQACV
jgi:hypothetical protein